MTENTSQKPGIGLGVAIILVFVLCGAVILYLDDGIVRPHKSIKWILIGVHTQFLGVFCIISKKFYNASFVFRYWTRMVQAGFIVRFKYDHIVHGLFFFIAGTWGLIKGLGVI